MPLFWPNAIVAFAGLASLNLVYASTTPGGFLDNLLSNPLVSNMAVLVALALGGYLLALLRSMTRRLATVTTVLDAQTETLKLHSVELRDASAIAIRTETLVNSKSSEMASHIEVLEAKLDAAQTAALVSHEPAPAQVASTVLVTGDAPLEATHVIVDPVTGHIAT